jgi:DNA-binding MurR/RpiR family transcriptional regulator
VADLALKAPETVALRSAAQIAEELGTSTSTVVRFATALGYAGGYPEFRRSLQADLVRGISTVNRLQVTETQLAGTGAPELIRDVLERDAQYVRDTVSLIPPDEFQSCVHWINHARRVYIIGLWSSHAPAYLLALGLRFIGSETRLMESRDGDVADDLHGASRDDVIIAVSIRRYARRAIAALDLARDLGLRRIAITDNPLGPLGVRADRVLPVRSGEDRFFRSITAVVSVVNALVTACVMADPRRAERSLASLEEIWARSDAHVADTQPGH